jgi:hypothetical protein
MMTDEMQQKISEALDKGVPMSAIAQHLASHDNPDYQNYGKSWIESTNAAPTRKADFQEEKKNLAGTITPFLDLVNENPNLTLGLLGGAAATYAGYKVKNALEDRKIRQETHASEMEKNKAYVRQVELQGKNVTSTPELTTKQLAQSVKQSEGITTQPKQNPLNAYVEQKYNVSLADLEAKTGGQLKSIADIDLVANTLQKGGNISVNPAGAFAPKSDYTRTPVMPTDGPFFNPSSAPTPSVKTGVETGNTTKAIQTVLAQEIDKTSGMYRDAQGNMVYPEKMSLAARTGAEAFAKQYPDIAKTLEGKGQFAILGGGSGDNSLFNTYDSELMKRLRNEVNQGQMVGPDINYTSKINPAIQAISPESALGKELADLKATQPKGGTKGTLGIPATIGGVKGGLMKGPNQVRDIVKAGGPAMLLMAMADAAKAAQQGNYGEAAVRSADVATDYIPMIAQLKQGLAPTEAGAPGVSKQTFENAYKLGSPYAQTEEAKLSRLREKAGAGRGIAPPSAYMR